MLGQRPAELYRYFTKDSRLLYVGVSHTTALRGQQHRLTSHWYSEASNITIEKYPTRAAALEAERKAILTEKPIYNVQRPSPSHSARQSLAKLEPAYPERAIRDPYVRSTTYLLRTLEFVRCFTSPEFEFWYKVVFLTPLGCVVTDSQRSYDYPTSDYKRLVKYNTMSEVTPELVIENWANWLFQSRSIWEGLKQKMVFHHWILG